MQRSDDEIIQVSEKIFRDLCKEVEIGRTTFTEFLMINCDILKDKKDLSREDRFILKKAKDNFLYTAPEVVTYYVKIFCNYKARGILTRL